MVPLLNVEHRWECRAPGCGQTAVTSEALPHTRFHTCRGRAGTAGLTVPMVPAGTRCEVVVRERDDWIGSELVQTNADGRPIMSVITTRDDGQDCTVYAPCATARAEDI